MSDYEQVDLDEPKGEARFTRSDYAQVLFHNIAETYLIDIDVECRYTIASLLTRTSSDWVGLYKVGWSNASRDYVIYYYAALPVNVDDDRDKEGCIHFQAAKLPKEDGEFYQFCYVTGSGHVRGASTPFQFRSSREEFIEIEDEDNDILVIRSRTAVLEEDLSKAMQEEKNLKKTLELLEHERDSLLSKMVNLERECQTEREDKHEVQNDLKKMQEKEESLRQEAADMQILQEHQRDQISVLKQEKESIETRMNDNDQYVVDLRDKIKALVNDKDALSGKNKSLEEEKDMYKSNFSSSESTLTGYKLEIDNLKKQLQASESNTAKLKSDVDTYKGNMNSEKKKMERQLSITQVDKNHIQDLTEKLRNSEDKLLAAEQCKQMLNKELDTAQQAYTKMSDDMEKSKSEAHSLKVKIAKLEDKSYKQEQSWQDELKYMQGRMDEKTQETEKIQQDVESWRKKFEEMEVEKKSQHEGPMFALQMAQQTLKQRLAKKQADNDELKKQVDDLMARKRKWEQLEIDLKNEIVDLKTHLLMGQDAFRDKYIECQKIRADLRKALKIKIRSRNTSESKELSRASSVDSKVLKEAVEVQTSPPTQENKETVTESEACKSDGHSQTTESLRAEDFCDLTNTEIQSQLDDLGRELEKRKTQKNKYKTLLAEEKEKNTLLQKHYFEEIKKQEEEMEKVKVTYKDKMDILQQKNNILKNALDRQKEEKQCLVEEHEHLLAAMEQQRQEKESEMQRGEAAAQPAAQPAYRYPPQQAPVTAYPPGDADMGNNQPLPLRFGSPYQGRYSRLPHVPQAPAAFLHYDVMQPTLVTENGCYRCGDDSHVVRDCPLFVGDKGCFKCGKDGHMSRDCPCGGGSSSGNACFKCGEEGHMTRDCPCSGSSGGSTACFKCGEEGHMPRDCPCRGSSGGSSNRACFKCGEEGHMPRDCPGSGRVLTPPPSPKAEEKVAAQLAEEYDPLAAVPLNSQDPFDSDPLPPPLEPQLTAEAKKAAIMAAMNGGSNSSSTEEIRAEDIFPDVVQQQPSAPPVGPEQSDVVDGEDERFQDAQGEPQKLCPICSTVFPPDTPNTAFLDHIDTHYGPVCPVCTRQFEDGFAPSKFQEHVETHFDD